MINFGMLIKWLLALIVLGSGAAYTLRQMESDSAAAAANAHRTGYISIEGFHRRLTSGR